jgi:hypothetical protein
MKMQQRKKQLTRHEHIVPRSYLENFCDPQGTLFVYEQGKDVRESRPERECHERDFYEYEVGTRKTENAYEDWLSGIEDAAKSLVPLIADSQPLGQREATTWACFVASLFARTRKVRAQFSSAMIERLREHTQHPEFVRDLQHELLRAGELVYTEDLRKQIDDLRMMMEGSPSNYHVTGLPRKTAILAEALLYKQWHTLCAPSGKFFVTSDCPVVTVERKGSEWARGSGFGNEKVMILLPLTPEKVFFAAPRSFSVNRGIGPAFVDSTNYLVVQFGHRNVYANLRSDEIKTLVDHEINQVVFGKNAFMPPDNAHS